MSNVIDKSAEFALLRKQHTALKGYIEWKRENWLRERIDDAIQRVTAAAPAAALERERLKREKVVALPSAKRGRVVNLQAAPVAVETEDQRRLDRLAEFMATGTVKRRKRRRRAKVIPIR
jgi:hypothetical protein